MGKLIIIPTPIGNLEDITLRALRHLKEADVILAEDTRVIQKLLQHFNIIPRKLKSYHQHNEHSIAAQIADELSQADSLIYCLVSDAGTPGISDPAYLLVKACIEKKIEVECLPGPTAFVPALVKSGLPSTSFCFEGFLPHKKGRQTALKKLAEEERTFILYESPFRIQKTLEELILYCGAERKASASRELTKVYEETINGTLQEILFYFKNHTIKGEFVICVQGKK